MTVVSTPNFAFVGWRAYGQRSARQCHRLPWRRGVKTWQTAMRCRGVMPSLRPTAAFSACLPESAQLCAVRDVHYTACRLFGLCLPIPTMLGPRDAFCCPLCRQVTDASRGSGAYNSEPLAHIGHSTFSTFLDPTPLPVFSQSPPLAFAVYRRILCLTVIISR
jgi:hypothetical protein